MGALHTLETVLPTLLKSPESTSVAIQGFGNAGAILAGLLFEAGYRIVAVSDSKRGIYAPDGLDIPSVRRFKENTRHLKAVYCADTVCDIVEHETISNEELLALDVDVLVPAALENQITEHHVDRIKARMILEVANGPVTPEADNLLFVRGIPVVPDILANAGGVTVSCFEWVQNRIGQYWSLEHVNNQLKERMIGETEQVMAIAARLSLPLRTVAYVRIEDAVSARGTKHYYTNGS